MTDAQYWIEALGLQEHPEGGFFRETFRSEESIPTNGLPERFTGKRVFATAIYYLLKSGQISVFHRIKSDEIWTFHSGNPLPVYAISQAGDLSLVTLGPDPASGHQFQCVVPAHKWFGAKLDGPDGYALVSCIVAPGFEFEDFEMAQRSVLTEAFPQHKDIIRQLTRSSEVRDPRKTE